MRPPQWVPDNSIEAKHARDVNEFLIGCEGNTIADFVVVFFALNALKKEVCCQSILKLERQKRFVSIATKNYIAARAYSNE